MVEKKFFPRETTENSTELDDTKFINETREEINQLRSETGLKYSEARKIEGGLRGFRYAREALNELEKVTTSQSDGETTTEKSNRIERIKGRVKRHMVSLRDSVQNFTKTESDSDRNEQDSISGLLVLTEDQMISEDDKSKILEAKIIDKFSNDLETSYPVTNKQLESLERTQPRGRFRSHFLRGVRVIAAALALVSIPSSTENDKGIDGAVSNVKPLSSASADGPETSVETASRNWVVDTPQNIESAEAEESSIESTNLPTTQYLDKEFFASPSEPALETIPDDLAKAIDTLPDTKEDPNEAMKAPTSLDHVSIDLDRSLELIAKPESAPAASADFAAPNAPKLETEDKEAPIAITEESVRLKVHSIDEPEAPTQQITSEESIDLSVDSPSYENNPRQADLVASVSERGISLPRPEDLPRIFDESERAPILREIKPGDTVSDLVFDYWKHVDTRGGVTNSEFLDCMWSVLEKLKTDTAIQELIAERMNITSGDVDLIIANTPDWPRGDKIDIRPLFELIYYTARNN